MVAEPTETVELNLTDMELLFITRAAHDKNKTLNQFIVDIMVQHSLKTIMDEIDQLREENGRLKSQNPARFFPYEDRVLLAALVDSLDWAHTGQSADRLLALHTELLPEQYDDDGELAIDHLEHTKTTFVFFPPEE